MCPGSAKKRQSNGRGLFEKSDFLESQTADEKNFCISVYPLDTCMVVVQKRLSQVQAPSMKKETPTKPVVPRALLTIIQG